MHTITFIPEFGWQMSETVAAYFAQAVDFTEMWAVCTFAYSKKESALLELKSTIWVHTVNCSDL